MTADEVIALYTELGAMNLAPISTLQARGDCPLCDNPEGHFYVRLIPGTSKSTGKPLTIGMWQCKFCGKQGNPYSLLREVHAGLSKTTSLESLKQLAKHRGLPHQHLKKHGVVYSPLTCEYLLPVFNAKKSITNLIRYDINAAEPKPYNSTGLGLSPFGLDRFPEKAKSTKDADGKPLPPIVYLTEGIWDYYAFTYLADTYNANYKQTYGESPPESDKFWTLGSPGTNFPEDSLAILRSWEVRILYDNDKAGKDGLERLVPKLKGIAAKILVLSWPESKELEGKDIRDLVTKPELIEETA